MTTTSMTVSVLNNSIAFMNTYSYVLHATTDPGTLALGINTNAAANSFTTKFYGFVWNCLPSLATPRFNILILTKEINVGAASVYLDVISQGTDSYFLEMGYGTQNATFGVDSLYALRTPLITRDGNWHMIMWYFDASDVSYQSSAIFLDDTQLGPLTASGDRAAVVPFVAADTFIFTGGLPAGYRLGQHYGGLDPTMTATDLGVVHNLLMKIPTPRAYGPNGPFYDGRAAFTFVSPEYPELTEYADVSISAHPPYQIVGNIDYSREPDKIIAGRPALTIS